MAAVFSTGSIRPAPFATVASIGTQAAELYPAHRLTTIIAVLATVASLGGLLLPELYRDNTLVTSSGLLLANISGSEIAGMSRRTSC